MTGRKIIHYDPERFGRLACDAEGCGYEEASGPLSPALIGKPCPRCGANLLTQEDHDAAVRLMRGIDLANGLFGQLGSRSASAGARRMEVRPHAGSLTVKITPPK